MEISIERSHQHWCPNEGSNSELFDHKNDAVTARPHIITQSTARQRKFRYDDVDEVMCANEFHGVIEVLQRFSLFTEKRGKEMQDLIHKFQVSLNSERVEMKKKQY